MNVCIFLFGFNVMYIITKITPKQHTLRSTVVIFFFFCSTNLRQSYVKKIKLSLSKLPKMFSEWAAPPPPCSIYLALLRQYYFLNLPETDLTLLFWVTLLFNLNHFRAGGLTTAVVTLLFGGIAAVFYGKRKLGESSWDIGMSIPMSYLVHWFSLAIFSDFYDFLLLTDVNEWTS